jgi:hypothetical protein
MEEYGMPTGTYTKTDDGTTKVWQQARLIELAKSLPVKTVRLDSIAEFDHDMWFGSGPNKVQPTCRAVAEHAKRINDANLQHPIILSATGSLMDGMHRAAKAYIEDKQEIQAVQFEVDPEPDEVRIA